MKISPITYYYDKQYKTRVPVNEEGNAILDWGEVVPGSIKSVKLFVKNELLSPISLRQPYTEDEEFKIKNYPTHMLPGETGEIDLEYSPNEERLTPLKSDWGFELVIG